MGWKPAGSEMEDNRTENADKNTLVIANSARLLRDAKLLADHASFASAFALALLGVEEIGKVILKTWEDVKPLAKPKVRSSAHVRKQTAVASLLLASFALREFGDAVGGGLITDELIEQVAKAFYESQEGRFLSHAQKGVLERTKHIGLYWDDWVAEHSLHPDQFDRSDVTHVFETARRTIEAVGDPRCMRVGRAIYEVR
jgi:AbiV family abortive infection protein